MNRISTLLICNLICAVPCFLNGQQVSFTHQNLLNPVSGFTAYADCAVGMDGNGLDDVVRVGAKGIYIDYQQSDRSFSQQFHPVHVLSPPEWSICAGDLDNNGYNDLLFASTEVVSFVLANQDGASYSESVMQVPLISQRSTIADIDNDGWLDAFVCNDTSMSVPFRNQGLGLMFPDTTLIHTSSRPGSYSAIWTDYDNDRDLDLYISKCLSGAGPNNPDRINLLYQNDGAGSFSEVAGAAGIADNAQSWSTVFEDFDIDGDFDAFVVNHDFQNRLYRNNGDATFTDVIAASGIDAEDLGAFENASGDFNNDGFIDIFSELNYELYLGNGDLTFTAHDAPAPPGAIADLNNDGFLDILQNGQVWLNDGNNETHWLKVIPFGIASNRNGIGARVEIHGAWGIQVREVRSGQSFSPMSSLTAHFGLGLHDFVDSLVIKWPAGGITVIKDILADETYVVPEAECALARARLDNLHAELCPGDTMTLSAPDGFTRYLWSNGDTLQTTRVSENGKYYTLFIDSTGCVGLSAFTDVQTAKDAPPQIIALPARRICAGDRITLIASSGQNHLWSNGLEGDQIVVSSSGNYTVSIDAQCHSGSIMSEEYSIEFLAAPPPEVMNIVVGQGDSVLINTTGTNCHWYDQPVSGNLVHIGCQFQTSGLFNDTTYYVESHPIYPGVVQSGGAPDLTTSGGLSEQTGFMFFEAYEPFTLLSVRVYLPDGAAEGSRFVQLFSIDTLLAFKQFQVNTGWNTLDLNFEVPTGNFSLHCPQGKLYRDLDSLNYPYPLGDAGQVTASSFGLDFYYYFYDWQIKTQDFECISERVPVSVSATEISETNAEGRIDIFPNPTTGTLTVRTEIQQAVGASIQLFDVNGRMVYQQAFPALNEFSIRLDGVPSGR
jgi:hypothetical protein